MGTPDFSDVTGYLATALGGVMGPLASFACDVLDPLSARDKRGHTQPGTPKAVNRTPIPCQVRDVTGSEIFVSGRRVVVSGTIITLPLVHEGARLAVGQSHRLRVRATALLPERFFEIEHVGDYDGIQITLVVKRLET